MNGIRAAVYFSKKIKYKRLFIKYFFFKYSGE